MDVVVSASITIHEGVNLWGIVWICIRCIGMAPLLWILVVLGVWIIGLSLLLIVRVRLLTCSIILIVSKVAILVRVLVVLLCVLWSCVAKTVVTMDVVVIGIHLD